MIISSLSLIECANLHFDSAHKPDPVGVGGGEGAEGTWGHTEVGTLCLIECANLHLYSAHKPDPVGVGGGRGQKVHGVIQKLVYKFNFCN